MYKVYQIKPGDTFETISSDLGIDLNVLEQLNGPISLTVGEYIIVPNVQNEYFTTYIVKKDDSLYSISKKYNITVDELAMINGINKSEYIYPNQEILIPNENIDIYITKIGDTLDTVLNGLNTDYLTITKENSKIYLLPEQLIINKKK